MKKTTRIISMLIAVIMLIGMLPISIFAADSGKMTVYVESTTGKPGKTAEVKICLDNNPGISSLKFKVAYDEYLTLKDVKFDSRFGSYVTASTPYKNPQTLSFVSPIEELSCDGEFATLTFEISNEVPDNYEAKIQLTYNPDDIFDEDFNNVDVTVTSGSVKIYHGIAGDINSDEKVDNRDAILLFRYLADWDVTVDPLALDVNGDYTINNKDAITLFRYVGEGEEHQIVIYYGTMCGHSLVHFEAKEASATENGNIEYWRCPVCKKTFSDSQAENEVSDVVIPMLGGCSHTLNYVAANDATCTEDGNVAYYKCSKCNKLFSDDKGVNEITLAQTVIKAKDHTYADEWSSDENYHWHNATCEHTSEFKDKAAHAFVNGECSVCGYIFSSNKLNTPIITKIEYDTVYWTAVNNADYYTVRVNDNYECTLRGTSCSLSYAKWNSEPISDYGIVKVEVRALENGKYQSSNWSNVDSSYFYVPETQGITTDTLIKYSIGFGYNMIEDEYLNINKCSQKSVFNVGKLLTIGNYTARNNSNGEGYSYNYKSVDEFLSKTKVSFEYGQKTGCVLLGSVKMQINAEIGFDYKKFQFNETYIYQYDITYKDHMITNFSDDNLLAYCLSDDFLKDVRKESTKTRNMTDDQLVEYLYDSYGTHAILGITTGGSYTAKYTISTNSIDIATAVDIGFSMSTEGGGAIDQIIQKDFNIDAGIREEINKSTSTTEAKFSMSYNGGNGGAATAPSDVGNAVSKWSASINEDNAISIKLTENGAISISSLLFYVDNNLGSKFENYVNSMADETYDLLFGIYNKAANLPVSVETQDDKNILIIDISGAQYNGNMEKYVYPNLSDGVFIVYPVMCNRDIDYIKVIGSYDTNDNLIDSFNLKLSKKWKNSDVKIILKNVGVYTTGSNGFIDISDVGSDVDLTIDFVGKNEISGHNGTPILAASSALMGEDITITSSDTPSSLIIRGGNGANGNTSGDNGFDGASAIIVNNLFVDTKGSIIFVGGNGGDGANGIDRGWYSEDGYAQLPSGGNGGNGGNGGAPINSTAMLSISPMSKLYLQYGNGGNGGNGGQGGNASWGEKGVKPDTGGNGGAGGTGGYGYIGGTGGNGGTGGYSFANESGGLFSKWQYGQCGSGGNAGKGGDSMAKVSCEAGSIKSSYGAVGLGGTGGPAGERGTKDDKHFPDPGVAGSNGQKGHECEVTYSITWLN